MSISIKSLENFNFENKSPYIYIVFNVIFAHSMASILNALIKHVLSGTCVLWTPWDRQKVSRLSRCLDFPGHFI